MPSQKLGWARLWAVARPQTEPRPRQGAWYPVVSRGNSFVVVDVHREHVMLPNHLVEMRDDRPKKFTVVYRPTDCYNPYAGTREDLGRRYVVCPECQARVRIHGQPETTACSSCGHRGIVAWWETG